MEGANPRHEHEWQVWDDVKLPKDVVLIPGVISHATNVVEHPELIQQRIVRLAKLVGRENVLASTDCGFAQQPFYQRVHPTIMWAKFQALVEGARLATKELWGTEEGGEEERRGKEDAGQSKATGGQAQARGVSQRLRRVGFFTSVFFSQSTSTPAISSLFFSSIIMWPLPRMPASSSRRNVSGTPACAR